MRLPVIVASVLLTMLFLSGCHHQSEDQAASLTTPKGYAKPQPIAALKSEESWEKRALFAIVAPSIAESGKASRPLPRRPKPRKLAGIKHHHNRHSRARHGHLKSQALTNIGIGRDLASRF